MAASTTLPFSSLCCSDCTYDSGSDAVWARPDLAAAWTQTAGSAASLCSNPTSEIAFGCRGLFTEIGAGDVGELGAVVKGEDGGEGDLGDGGDVLTAVRSSQGLHVVSVSSRLPERGELGVEGEVDDVATKIRFAVATEATEAADFPAILSPAEAWVAAEPVMVAEVVVVEPVVMTAVVSVSVIVLMVVVSNSLAACKVSSSPFVQAAAAALVTAVTPDPATLPRVEAVPTAGVAAFLDCCWGLSFRLSAAALTGDDAASPPTPLLLAVAGAAVACRLELINAARCSHVCAPEPNTLAPKMAARTSVAPRFKYTATPSARNEIHTQYFE